MKYYAYIAVRECVGAVALFRTDCTEVWHRSLMIQNVRASKYNAWFECCKVLLNCLRDSVMQGVLQEDDTVQINMPVYVLYKWLTGTKVPIKYSTQKEKLEDGLRRVPCTVEITPVFGTPNRAVQFCVLETYKNALTEFTSE